MSLLIQISLNCIRKLTKSTLSDIIASSGDDFTDSLEVFDAVGEILMEGDSTKSEAQARTLIISPAGC